MNTSKQVNIMVALLFAALIATGAYMLWDPERSDSAEDRQLEKVVERGAFLFSQNCRTCHGDLGEGGLAGNRLRAAPALNRPDLQGIDPTTGKVDEQRKSQKLKLVTNTITCGRVGTAMPTWAEAQGGTLIDEQIKQLTRFIVEGTAWDEAKHFAVEGAPSFDVHGDDQYNIHLAQPLDENATTVALDVSDINFVLLSAGVRLAIGEDDEEAGTKQELMLIQSVDAKAKTAVVERGLGNTSPAAHEAGAEVIVPPSPPDPPAVNEAACGQFAQEQATAAPEPPSTALTISAKNVKYNKGALAAIAGQPLTLTFDNQDDASNPHNWALYASEDELDTPIAATEIEQGPVTQTLTFGPLEAGDYFFKCDVHAQMSGTLTASEPGGATPAAETTATATP